MVDTTSPASNRASTPEDSISIERALALCSEGFAQDRFHADRIVHLSAVLHGQPGDLIDHDNADFCEQARLQRGMLRAPELPSLAQMMGEAA